MNQQVSKYANVRVKCKYPFPRHQFLWSLGYILGENMGKGKKKEGKGTGCISECGFIPNVNMCTLRYCFVMWSNLGMHTLKSDRCWFFGIFF